MTNPQGNAQQQQFINDVVRNAQQYLQSQQSGGQQQSQAGSGTGGNQKMIAALCQGIGKTLESNPSAAQWAGEALQQNGTYISGQIQHQQS